MRQETDGDPSDILRSSFGRIRHCRYCIAYAHYTSSAVGEPRTLSLRNLVLGYECGRVFPAGVELSSPSRDAANWLSSRLSRSVETRRRCYDWLRIKVFPGARFYRVPIWCPSRGGDTREVGSTLLAESLIVLYRVGTHQVRRGWRVTRSSTSQGSAEPLCAGSKARTGRFLREKLISDQSLFSSFQGQERAPNGHDLWGFFKDAQGFGRLDAGSCTGFTRSRPPPPWTSVFHFFLYLYYLWL